jgi:hypothetical protein
VHAAREKTSAEVRRRKEAEAEVAGLHTAVAARDEQCAALGDHIRELQGGDLMAIRFRA